MGIACQLASPVGIVIPLLQTAVANVALVTQAERIGKGGDSPGERKETLGEKSQSKKEGHEIEEDEHRVKRLQYTRIGKTAKKAKSAESLPSSGNNTQETLAIPQSTRKQTQRRPRRNKTKSKAKQSDLTIDETTGSASKSRAQRKKTETTEKLTTSETIPSTRAEQPGETRNNQLSPPRQSRNVVVR